MRIFALLSLAFACTALARTQAPAVQEAPPTLRITVTLVQVDAVVTDLRGRRVANLRPEDFEILQDGQPQPIKLFSYTPEAPPQAAAGQIGPSQSITAGQVKRTIALIVDDLALSFPNLVQTRESIRKYVEQQMLPGDLVAIVRTGGGIVALEQFTTDRRMLLPSANSLKWRFRGRCGIIPVRPRGQEGEVAPSTPEVLDYGCAMSVLGALGTIEHVVGGMRNLPGRKSVVLFSDNLRMDDRVQLAINELTDLANRSAVTLYAIDPGGLQTFIDAEDSAGVPTGSILGDLIANRSEEAARATHALGYLARSTGGIFFNNNNDIPGCIRAAADDQLGYYLLGYTPPDGTFNQETSSPRFRKLLVKIKKPGLRVRWKSGFNGVPDELVLSDLTQKTREQQLSEALASPFTAAGVRVRLTSMFTHFGKEGPGVRSMLHFDARDLAFTKQDDGYWKAAVDVVISAYKGVRHRFWQGEKLELIRLPDDSYKQALREGLLLLLDDPLKETGPSILRAVVRDTESGRLGSASQFVEIPDLKKERLALSGILIRFADSEVMKELLLDPAWATADGNGEPWGEGGPAVRRYKPGHNLVYSFLILNPKLKGNPKRPNVTLQVRVFRNGHLIFTGTEAQLTFESRLDDTRFLAAGVLKFGKHMQPGEYLLQASVYDRNAGKKHARASEWIDFEVVP